MTTFVRGTLYPASVENIGTMIEVLWRMNAPLLDTELNARIAFGKLFRELYPDHEATAGDVLGTLILILQQEAGRVDKALAS